jgi:hypothetical protein
MINEFPKAVNIKIMIFYEATPCRFRRLSAKLRNARPHKTLTLIKKIRLFITSEPTEYSKRTAQVIRRAILEMQKQQS